MITEGRLIIPWKIIKKYIKRTTHWSEQKLGSDPGSSIGQGASPSDNQPSGVFFSPLSSSPYQWDNVLCLYWSSSPLQSSSRRHSTHSSSSGNAGDRWHRRPTTCRLIQSQSFQVLKDKSREMENNIEQNVTTILRWPLVVVVLVQDASKTKLISEHHLNFCVFILIHSLHEVHIVDNI